MTSNKSTGLLLIAAASLFWMSWLFMPGVGITDAKLILKVVATQRPLVLLSVTVQLLSAALYVPALIGSPELLVRSGTPARWGAGLLLLGAMGSAADAVFHLLAYAMTQPGLDSEPLVRVMVFMQGQGLALILPLIFCFFVGGIWLALALARTGRFTPASAWLQIAAIIFGVLGGLAASAGLFPARAVGLAVLFGLSAGQARIGLELYRA